MHATDQTYEKLATLEEQVFAIASSFGLTVTRSAESFVSYDGAGVLNISPDSELDADDSIAQIVIHELAHHWVEGVDSYERRDWGLSNFDSGHLDREYAALRLQLAILARHGLRRVLHPTTVHRWFYEELLVGTGADSDVSTAAIDAFECRVAQEHESIECPSREAVGLAARNSRQLYTIGWANFTDDPRRPLVTDLLREIESTLRRSDD